MMTTDEAAAILTAALMPLFEGVHERQKELSALLDQLEAEMKREFADATATRSGTASSSYGGARPAVPGTPDAWLCEDGRTILLMDPAADPRWSVSFALPGWFAFDPETAIVRVTPNGRNVIVAGDPEARPELFAIPEPIRRDLRRHGAIFEDSGAA